MNAWFGRDGRPHILRGNRIEGRYDRSLDCVVRWKMCRTSQMPGNTVDSCLKERLLDVLIHWRDGGTTDRQQTENRNGKPGVGSRNLAKWSRQPLRCSSAKVE